MHTRVGCRGWAKFRQKVIKKYATKCHLDVWRDVVRRHRQGEFDARRAELRTIENGRARVVQSYRGFDELEAIFIHVPKTAGISVSHALFGREVGHARARELRLIFGRDFWRYFKFSFVRNPFARLVSAYEYLKNGGHPAFTEDQRFNREVISRYPSFEAFVTQWLTAETMRSQVHFMPQSDFITLDGVIVADFLGRFERLDADFDDLCRSLAVSARLLQMNATSGSASKTLRAYYTSDALVRHVIDLYETDFLVGGYSCDRP